MYTLFVYLMFLVYIYICIYIHIYRQLYIYIYIYVYYTPYIHLPYTLELVNKKNIRFFFGSVDCAEGIRTNPEIQCIYKGSTILLYVETLI